MAYFYDVGRPSSVERSRYRDQPVVASCPETSDPEPVSMTTPNVTATATRCCYWAAVPE